MINRNFVLGFGLTLAGCQTPLSDLHLPNQAVFETQKILSIKYEAAKIRLNTAFQDKVVSKEDLREYERFFGNLEEASLETQEKVINSMNSIIDSKYQIDKNFKAAERLRKQNNLPLLPFYDGGLI